MKRGALLNRGIAAVVTIVFMALVRPEEDPALWESALVSILMYEGIRICLDYIHRINRKQRIRRNTEAMHYDGERWARERMDWPIYEEVS